MEDSFKQRVDKVFGSLLQSEPPPPSLSTGPSPWTLSDEEVERRKWNRERGSPDREDTPCSSSFDGFFSTEKKDNPRNPRNSWEEPPDDLDEDDCKGLGNQLEEAEKEEWEIRNSIGLDSTLDHEDEEDEFDKVAIGRENASERLYMRDITDYGSYLNSHNVLHDSYEEVEYIGRDLRANHLAAKARLQEDKEAATSFDSPQACDDDMPVVVESKAKIAEDGGNVKPILKRKETQMDSKSKKRVRFDLECETKELEKVNNYVTVKEPVDSTINAQVSPLPVEAPESRDYAQNASKYVPDYIRNPQKYTCYTFDSTDEDDRSNLQAYMDFCNSAKNSTTASVGLESSADLPKTVTFTPRKKAGEHTGTNSSSGTEDPIRRAACLVGIAAGEQEDSEACAMEEDDPGTSTVVDKTGGSRRPDRRYRSKVPTDD